MSKISEEKSNRIWTIAEKSEKKFLSKKTSDFDFSKHSQKEIDELVARMRKIMSSHNGIGLSANQIGINAKVFVAQLPNEKGIGYVGKFYAVFNSKIDSISNKKDIDQEGCLSVPGLYGDVERPIKISIKGLDKRNKPIKIKAKGLLARIFQHEIDHLNGILFIDRTKLIYKISDNANPENVKI